MASAKNAQTKQHGSNIPCAMSPKLPSVAYMNNIDAVT
ncbi:hypothetical protein FH063_002331 [Azospirillum argentinense]|uniref:Uncharacterized protein n=1 Tax=Azospirillum argentinense TaxID=2970906 RepID=A0A5B0KNA4_9PROT|nr:hypothetical protein FH063_002331 [Azospirillum argentinense]